MTTLTREKIHERLEKVSNLPSIPQVVLRIKEITENPRASVADLANCILSDHQLTSRILRMANSAYYGEFSGRITTVTHAIMLMGFRAVRNIAISMVVYDAVNNISRGSGFDVKAFWSRSLASGVIAKYLARATGQTKLLEVAFIAGFMHDIGQVVLASAFPDEYRELSKVDCDPSQLQNTERILLGVDHLEAGEYIARKWNLPELLVRPIGEHNRPRSVTGSKTSSGGMLVDMVHLAELAYPFVSGRASVESRGFKELARLAFDLLAIDRKVMADLPEVCRKEVGEIASDLDIKIDPLRPENASGADLAEIQRQLSGKELQLSFLQGAAESLFEAGSEEEILLIVCEAVFRGLQMGRVLLLEYDADGGQFVGRLGFGVATQEEIKALSFPADGGLFGQLRTGGRTIPVGDRTADIDQMIAATAGWNALGTSSFVLAPVKVLDRVVFALFADSTDRNVPMDEERLRSVTALANQGSMALERILMRRRLSDDDTGKS